MKIRGIENPATPKATRKPTVRDLEWAAGFLEGEGCFKYSGTSQQVDVGQVQREPLNRLQEIFGGTVILTNKKKPTHQDYHMWRVYGPRARGVMMTLYTLMSPKRKAQIKKALGY